jgi:diaminohydroxyphosphoribosylaminopyrimidine deaminase/5-amino-6-(5-phosphoribosylamino)uracil reductase
MDAFDRRTMRRAVELARRSAGRTAPNPMVGAVVVQRDQVIAEGRTQPPGQDHAEPHALKQLAPGQAQGATMYVSLEPCCHHGKTPPCTDYILDAGISRVVVGMVDPDPRVQGNGIRILRDAGIRVDVGIEEALCRDVNAGFIKAQELGLPRVWLKAGMTLDGRIADSQGTSQWITSAEARLEGRRMRDRSDGILVGAGTLRADDPQLTTRIEGGRDPVRAVLDTRLEIPSDARVLHAGDRPPVIFCATDAPERDLPADVVRVPHGPDGLDLNAVLSALVDRGVHNLLVEGGGALHRSLLDQGLADRMLLFVAPMLLPGGRSFVAGAPVALSDAATLRYRGTRRVGPDLLLDLEVA